MTAAAHAPRCKSGIRRCSAATRLNARRHGRASRMRATPKSPRTQPDGALMTPPFPPPAPGIAAAEASPVRRRMFSVLMSRWRICRGAHEARLDRGLRSDGRRWGRRCTPLLWAFGAQACASHLQWHQAAHLIMSHQGEPRTLLLCRYSRASVRLVSPCRGREKDVGDAVEGSLPARQQGAMMSHE